MLYQSMYSIEENMRITLFQDSIEVEAAKHFNKDRRQSSFCLAKVIVQEDFITLSLYAKDKIKWSYNDYAIDI